MSKQKTRKPTVAVVTMAYNEQVNLPVWHDHYRRALPSATLFVIDHGSDDGSVLAQRDISRFPLPRGQMDEVLRARFVGLLQGSLLQYYDLVIYTDCDELIVVDPALSVSLEAYLAERDYEYASPIGLNVQHIVDAEPPLRADLPMLAQRRYCFFHSQMCKPLISRVRLKWEPGFHASDRPLRIDRNLYLFHIKCIDRDRAAQRQKILQNVKWTKKAIDAQHSTHHRFNDELFLRQFFLDPANRFRRDGVQPFDVTAELERLEPAMSGNQMVAPFIGPIMEIPERFRTAF